MIVTQPQTEAFLLTAATPDGEKIQRTLKAEQGIFIGASSNCGIQLIGEEISDIQCHVSLEEGKIWIQDWMSAGGTRVNDTEVVAKMQLQSRDVIRVAEYEITCQQAKSESIDPVATQAVDSVSQEEAMAPAGSKTLGETPETEDAFIQSETVVAELPTEAPLGAFDAPLASDPGETVSFGDDVFELEADTFDRETVELLQLEIEALRTELAERDSQSFVPSVESHPAESANAEPDEVLDRMKQLVDEANRSDERASLLEEMLHAAEDANRSEQEERNHIEAWVGEIEQRVGDREDEHRAEIGVLQRRITEADSRQATLQKRIQQAAFNGSAPKEYEDTLTSVQQENQTLQSKVAALEKQCLNYKQRLDQITSESELALREERANLAREQANTSRLRFELSSKLAAIEEIPKEENMADKEIAFRIRTLRDHLKEIHEQEQADRKEETLATRIGKLWKRMEY